mmetsp:Transcript_13634/g.27175  ORF Transcript_13634/g.27175 Transcript_13634/m.27175 type:complete len:379 (+) Transcript_13634:96-1232(+)
MSSAAARRYARQVKARRAAAAENGVTSAPALASGGGPAVAAADSASGLAARMDSLLKTGSGPESYEALQLASSVVRRYAKAGDVAAAMATGTTATMRLLSHGKIPTATQLSRELIDMMMDYHATATDETIRDVITPIHEGYVAAIAASVASSSTENDGDESAEDPDREHHISFLRDAVRWTDKLGTFRHGDPRVHAHLSSASFDAGRWQDGVTHGVYAEDPKFIAARLQSDPELNPPGGGNAGDQPRDVALTAAILMFLALENARDASACLRAFLEADRRDTKKLTAAFLTSKSSPNYVTFCCSLVRICETDNSGWFNWITSGSQCGRKLVEQNKGLQPYLTKIGKVYFGVQPPPSMLSMMENMMGMMGGMGGMGAGF